MSVQQLPSRSDYSAALKNLGTQIAVAELKPYQVELTKRGEPKVYSGGFAMTCPIKHPTTGRKKALRLFVVLTADLEQRYQAISQFVTQHIGTGIFADVKYLRQGIRVGTGLYPICYMDWVEGLTLAEYIRNHIHNGDYDRITPLPDAFVEMIDALRGINAAHGDLSGENIMALPDGRLVLVDYDGMFVPALNGFAPCVAGQYNFQHPQRFTSAYSGYFGAYQDNFSSIALYLALKALALDPTIQDRHGDDGRILFKKDDYADPDASALLAEMEQHDELAGLVEQFRQICKNDLDGCPTLSDFLKGRLTGARATLVDAMRASNTHVFTPEGNPVFLASNVDQSLLMQMQGNTGTLTGRIERVHRQPDAVVYEFSSGAGPSSALYVIDDALDALTNGSVPPDQYVNQWVKATGNIQVAQIAQYLVPSIEIENLSQITVISTEEHMALLRGEEYRKPDSKPEPTWTPPPNTTQPAPTRGKTLATMFDKPSDVRFPTQPSATSTQPAPPDVNTKDMPDLDDGFGGFKP
jgi:hypothetical protein